MKNCISILLLLLLLGHISYAQKPPLPTKKDCKKDADQDGINDCFDQCANTPKNTRVDSKGCPRDTDGDGVPDYKDKQLITPTECQPADSNGIGKCEKIFLER